MKKIWTIMASVFMIVVCLCLMDVSAQAAEVIDSGEFGDNEYWSINDEGKLNIMGTGPISFSNIADCPWYDYYDEITTAHIGPGVTSLGSYTFYECRNLTSISIPSSVTSVYSGGFTYCEKISDIYITDIAAWCNIADGFYGHCSKDRRIYVNGELLTELVIPDGLTAIGSFAFYNCVDLTSVTIPDSVLNIGYGAFRDCSSLTSLRLPEYDYETWDSDWGTDYNPQIEDYAFYGCSGLTSITIKDNYCVGNYAFYGCSGLTSLMIEKDTGIIGSYAFADCDGLTSVTIPSSVFNLCYGAFADCDNLTNITYEGNDYKVDEQGALYDEDMTTLICVPAGLKGSIVVPEGVTKIEISAFEGCSGLTSITLPESITTIGRYAFEGCSGLTSITLPEGITKIGDHTFEGCSSLTDITIPDSVTSIGYCAFTDCSGLTSIALSSSVTSIDSYAFQNCSSLTSITLPEGITTIGDHMFEGCGSLTDVTLPNNVTSIGSYAFADCSSLTSITLPESVTSIGYHAFEGCSSLTGITIPDSVTAIYACVFADCSSLTSITLPDSVTSIGPHAFAGCSSLTSITIPEGVTRIYDHAFEDCSSLTSVTLPTSITYIGAYGFMGCSSLRSITIPARVTSIGDSAFEGCTSLEKIYFLGSAPSIGSSSFTEVTAVASYPCAVYFPERRKVNYGGTLTWEAVHGYEAVTTAPTCLEDGFTAHTCTDCGDTYTSDIVAATGHSNTSEVTAPTCTENGYTTYTCTICGNSYTDDEIAATGHSYENGSCTVCGAADPDIQPVIIPTLSAKYPSLSFEDEIFYNVYFTVDDLTSVVEMGLITFDNRLADGTVDDAVDVVAGYAASGDQFMVHTNGIPAKNLSDTVYFKVYAKLSDGSYVYSDVAGYHAVAYANSVLNNASYGDDVKALMVAMLNYGAAAQVQFNYKTDALMNASLTAEQLALVSAYDEAMLDDVVNVDSAKVGAFVMNGGYSSIWPTVSFEGAFSINYYFTPSNTPDDGLTFYYWDAATYNSVDVLTAENATGTAQMVQDGDSWFAAVDGIAAKDMDETVYVAASYTAGGTTYNTNVVAYSLGKYCESIAAEEDAIGAATAVYGYYAKTYFAS